MDTPWPPHPPRAPRESTDLPDADWQRLLRYAFGEMGSAEAEATRTWIASDAERGRVLDLIVAAERAGQRQQPSADPQRALDRLHAELFADTAHASQPVTQLRALH